MSSNREAALRYYHANREKCLERQRAWREANPDYQKQWINRPENRTKYMRAKRERRQDVQEYVRECKLELGCSVCGYNQHHAALEWHHHGDDKKINVSFCQSIKAADEEMAKCVVLCSNCHKIHHWETKPLRKNEVPVYNNMPDVL